MLPLDSGSFSETALGYFGIVGWAAVLLCLRPGSPRPRAERALLVLLAVGWTVAAGVWPVAEIFSRTPGFRLIFPLRFHLWEAIAGPAIAALELDRFARDARAGRRPWIAVVLIAGRARPRRPRAPRRLRGRAASRGPWAVWFQKRQLLVIAGVLGTCAAAAFLLRRRPELFVAAASLLCGGGAPLPVADRLAAAVRAAGSLPEDAPDPVPRRASRGPSGSPARARRCSRAPTSSPGSRTSARTTPSSATTTSTSSTRPADTSTSTSRSSGTSTPPRSTS